MDRFDSLPEPRRPPEDPTKYFLKRLLVVEVIFGTTVIFWMIIHPLAPGSVSISISAPTQFLAGAPEKIKVTMNSEHGYPAYTTSAGWLGYSDEQLRQLCRDGVAEDARVGGVEAGARELEVVPRIPFVDGRVPRPRI